VELFEKPLRWKQEARFLSSFNDLFTLWEAYACEAALSRKESQYGLAGSSLVESLRVLFWSNSMG
jgi:hypothetical protein